MKWVFQLLSVIFPATIGIKENIICILTPSANCLSPWKSFLIILSFSQKLHCF